MAKAKTSEKEEIRTIPEYKKKVVSDLSEKMKKSKTILLASTRGLPSSQFHEIKKKLRGKAEIFVAKKSLVLRAIQNSGKGTLQNIKELIDADIALFFSEMDAFELSALLIENESPAKAKTGDIAPEDIEIEAGPTELMPGPAISELGAVGLKVAVENGKIAIKQGRVVTKKGEVIEQKVSDVLSKLNILPMKVGFSPVAAYDSVSDKVYQNIKIDKKKTLEVLRESIAKALSFAVNVKYITKQTIGYFIAKAGLEEKAIESLANKTQNNDKEVQ